MRLFFEFDQRDTPRRSRKTQAKNNEYTLQLHLNEININIHLKYSCIFINYITRVMYFGHGVLYLKHIIAL